MSEPWKFCSLSMDRLYFHTDRRFSPIFQRLLHHMNMLSCCLKLGKDASMDISLKKEKIFRIILKLISICSSLLLIITWNQESRFAFMYLTSLNFLLYFMPFMEVFGLFWLLPGKQGLLSVLASLYVRGSMAFPGLKLPAFHRWKFKTVSGL